VEWAERRDSGNPRCVEDLEVPHVADILAGITESHHLDKCVDASFAGTEEFGEEPLEHFFDGISGPEDEATADVEDDVDKEQELLEVIPLPGNPVKEQDRKAKWLALPRRARIAIRRLHRNFKHLPKNALVQMLRAAHVPKAYIDAAKAHRCAVCEQTKPKPRTSKVAPPKPYVFNHEVGIDVLDVKDAAGTFFDILNCVDYGTTFEQAFIVRAVGVHGTPSSSACLDVFVKGWVRPFGWPKLVAADRGTHSRGIFKQTISKKGVMIRPAGLESREQIGRVERRNQTLKTMMSRVIKETNAIGKQAIDMVLSECICAMNEQSRHGGFAAVH